MILLILLLVSIITIIIMPRYTKIRFINLALTNDIGALRRSAVTQLKKRRQMTGTELSLGHEPVENGILLRQLRSAQLRRQRWQESQE